LNKIYSNIDFKGLIYDRTAHINQTGLSLIRYIIINLLSLFQLRQSFNIGNDAVATICYIRVSSHDQNCAKLYGKRSHKNKQTNVVLNPC
jgi:hypothetical protein